MPNIWIDLDDFDDDDLAEELESRGHKVVFAGDDEDSDEEVERLKQQTFEVLKSWDCDSPEVFEKNMRIFFERWYRQLRG